MIITYKSKPIKLVPKKYSKIPNITDYLEDFENIRLSNVERKHLDMALFIKAAESFLMYLSLLEPLVYELVENAKPVSASRIGEMSGETYTVLTMSNGMSVRCDESVFRISPVKYRLRYANSLSNIVFQQSNMTQLKCFD